MPIFGNLNSKFIEREKVTKTRSAKNYLLDNKFGRVAIALDEPL